MAEWSVTLDLIPRRLSLSSTPPPDGTPRPEWLRAIQPWQGLRGVPELLDREFGDRRPVDPDAASAEGGTGRVVEWHHPSTTKLDPAARNCFRVHSEAGQARVFEVEMDLRDSRTEFANVVLRIADDVSAQVYIGELDEFVSHRLLDFTEALARTRAAQFVRGRSMNL